MKPLSPATNAVLGATALASDARTRNGKARGPLPFPFTLARDIALAPKEYLVDGLVGTGETSVWYGPPEAGKSCCILDACCHVAAGVDWCGRRVHRGAVLYVAAERGAVTHRRVIAWRQHHGQCDIPLAVVADTINLRTGNADADRLVATAQALSAACGISVVWIIIDTLNRALAGGDESSSKDMGGLIASIDRIQRATSAHVSVIHHVPVDRTDRMRGHGSVLGAADLTVRITKQDKSVTIEADKANDLPDKPRHTFRFQSVELARDSETDTVTTAPVIVPCDGSAVPRGRAWPRGLILLRDCITEALLQAGQDHRPGGDGPPVKAVEVHIAREVHRKRYVSAGDGDRETAERQAWSRNFKTARNHNLIVGEVAGARELIWVLGHRDGVTP